MKVIVSGGGVGGLALAQGLRGSGHDVVVFERGTLPDGPSGYRLRLDSRAVGVLEDLLPPDVHSALLASGPGSAVNRRLTYLDRRLRMLGTAREDDTDLLMIGRGPLLRLLAHGLGDAVRWGSEVASFRVTPHDASVVCRDGHVETGDVVVAADGARSPLRRQLLGDDGRRELGIGAVSGRVPGRASGLGLERLAGILAGGYALASGPRQVGVFLSAHDPDTGQAVDPAAVGPVPADQEEPYLVWGLLGPDRLLPDDEGPARLMHGAGALLADWHPELRGLPSASDPESVQRYGLNAAPSVPRWPTTAVTLLGDAVHVVPPTGGIGASTAVRDAGHLVRELRGITDRAGLLHALRRYEDTMRGYADGVVDGSVAPLRWQRRVASPAVHAAATTALAGVSAVRELVRR